MLEKWGSNARFFKYSAMTSDGRLRTPRNTRINGHSMTMLPYTAQHVAKSHEIMQKKHVYTDFGVEPPSVEEVRSLWGYWRPAAPACPSVLRRGFLLTFIVLTALPLTFRPLSPQEEAAQRGMEKDPHCFAFVVCTQERPGNADCAATIVGRAQIQCGHDAAKVRRRHAPAARAMRLMGQGGRRAGRGSAALLP